MGLGHYDTHYKPMGTAGTDKSQAGFKCDKAISRNPRPKRSRGSDQVKENAEGCVRRYPKALWDPY